jgi:hypothetical protein
MLKRIIWSPKKIIMISVVAILATLAILTYIPRIFTVFMIKLQYSRETTPGVFLIPTERRVEVKIDGLSDVSSYRFNDLSFKSPFGKSVEVKKIKRSNLYLYPQDRNVYVSELDNNLREMFVSVAEDDEQQERVWFGDKVLSSNYYAHKKALESTPERIGFFSSGEDISLAIMLLLWKTLIVPDDSHSVNSFSVGEIKGFQIGVPSKSYNVCILAYKSDNQAYEIHLIGKTVTQQDVDYLIYSIEIKDKRKADAISR